MIVWTRNFNDYLRWALYNIITDSPVLFRNCDTMEIHSALFGYWYCEVKGK